VEYVSTVKQQERGGRKGSGICKKSKAARERRKERKWDM